EGSEEAKGPCGVVDTRGVVKLLYYKLQTEVCTYPERLLGYEHTIFCKL
ncbi:hypothetical protein A2U01_0087341, partial [Trifolium medium]|nr:hypothetical protein [Trifolium medium]